MYEASDFGRIKSLKYGKEKILRAGLNSSGYFNVILCKKGKEKGCLVHRLVYEAFNGLIPEGLTIDHIDSNRENNSLENLQLLTLAENTRKAHIGKKRTEETKRKISVALKGKKRGPYKKQKLN